MKKTYVLLTLVCTLGLTGCFATTSEPPRPEPNPPYVEGAGGVWECKQPACRRVR